MGYPQRVVNSLTLTLTLTLTLRLTLIHSWSVSMTHLSEKCDNCVSVYSYTDDIFVIVL